MPTMICISDGYNGYPLHLLHGSETISNYFKTFPPFIFLKIKIIIEIAKRIRD